MDSIICFAPGSKISSRKNLQRLPGTTTRMNPTARQLVRHLAIDILIFRVKCQTASPFRRIIRYCSAVPTKVVRGIMQGLLLGRVSLSPRRSINRGLSLCLLDQDNKTPMSIRRGDGRTIRQKSSAFIVDVTRMLQIRSPRST